MLLDTENLLPAQFGRAAHDTVPDNAETKIAIVDHFLEKAGKPDTDEFVLASSLIAGYILDRDEAERFDSKMSEDQTAIYFEFTNIVGIDSSRDTIFAAMIETGLLPGSYGRASTPHALRVENRGPSCK